MGLPQFKASTNANHVWSWRQKKRLMYRQLKMRHENRRSGYYLHITCEKCKQEFPFGRGLEVDHIDGNSYHQDVKNLQLLCKPCHREKTAKEQGYGSGRSEDGVRILIERGYGKQQRLRVSRFRPFKLPRVSIRAVAKEVGVSHVALSKAWNRYIEQEGSD